MVGVRGQRHPGVTNIAFIRFIVGVRAPAFVRPAGAVVLAGAIEGSRGSVGSREEIEGRGGIDGGRRGHGGPLLCSIVVCLGVRCWIGVFDVKVFRFAGGISHRAVFGASVPFDEVAAMPPVGLALLDASPAFDVGPGTIG